MALYTVTGQAELPGGELGVGKSRLPRSVLLRGLTPWPALGPPGFLRRQACGAGAVWGLGAQPAGAGIDGRGKEEPPLGTWAKLCAALGLSPSSLSPPPCRTCRMVIWKTWGAWDSLGRGLSSWPPSQLLAAAVRDSSRTFSASFTVEGRWPPPSAFFSASPFPAAAPWLTASPLDQASGPMSLGDFCSGKRVAFLLWLRMFLEVLSSHPHVMGYTCWACPHTWGLEVPGLRTECLPDPDTPPAPCPGLSQACGSGRPTQRLVPSTGHMTSLSIRSPTLASLVTNSQRKGKVNPK